MQGTQRNTIIDAYRGIAILGVMAYHYFIRWADLYGFDHAYSPWMKLGAYGVSPFFVVSGLVIAASVQRSGPVDFLVRRAARLYPAFVFSAVLTFVLMRLFGPEHFQRSFWDLAASLTMDARMLDRRYVDGTYWCVAVEIKFYLWVALARWLLKDMFWLGLIGVALASALHLGPEWEYLTLSMWWPFFLMGMAGAFFIREGHRGVAGVLLAVALALYAIDRPGTLAVDVFCWGLGLSLLALLAWAPEWRPWPLRLLAGVGLVSYPLYLVHQNIGVSMIAGQTGRGMPDLVAVAIAAATMLGLAWAIHRRLEVPAGARILLWYDRRFRRRTGRNLQSERAPALETL